VHKLPVPALDGEAPHRAVVRGRDEVLAAAAAAVAATAAVAPKTSGGDLEERAKSA